MSLRWRSNERGTAIVESALSFLAFFLLLFGVMEAGRFMQIGTPTEIYEFPTSRLVANFIGNADMFEGRIVENGAPSPRPGAFLPLPLFPFLRFPPPSPSPVQSSQALRRTASGTLS